MTDFPPDKDLPPGSIIATVVLDPSAEPDQAPNLVRGLRDAYAGAATPRQQSSACDLVIMAVPAGRGKPFVEGLMERINNDEGGQVLQ